MQKTIPMARKKSFFKGIPACATRSPPVEEKQQPADDERDDDSHLKI